MTQSEEACWLKAETGTVPAASCETCGCHVEGDSLVGEELLAAGEVAAAGKGADQLASEVAEKVRGFVYCRKTHQKTDSPHQQEHLTIHMLSKTQDVEKNLRMDCSEIPSAIDLLLHVVCCKSSKCRIQNGSLQHSICQMLSNLHQNSERL